MHLVQYIIVQVHIIPDKTTRDERRVTPTNKNATSQFSGWNSSEFSFHSSPISQPH